MLPKHRNSEDEKTILNLYQAHALFFNVYNSDHARVHAHGGGAYLLPSILWLLLVATKQAAFADFR